MSILGRKVPTKVVAAIAGLMLLAAIAGLTLLVALLPARSSTPTREVTLGTAFEHKVPVAAVDGRPALIIRTLQPPASDVQLGTPDRVFGVFTLSGLYVGMIPVMVGLLWFPFLKRLSVRVGGMDFLLALTVGLLAFLLVDGAHEGFESAELLPKSFQGAVLFALAAAGAYLLLEGVGAWLRARRRTAGEGQGGWVLAVLVAVGIGLHNFGEGLAIGSAFALGEAALGTLPIIGFTLHNTAEGLAIVAPLARERERVSVADLAKLGLIGGVPMIMGAWIGGFVYSPVWSVLFLAIGVGATAQVIGQIVRQMTREGSAARMLALAGEAQALDHDKWVIDANRAGLRERLHEFWRYRRVLNYFSTRAVTGMYQGTSLGIFWLFARPLLPIAISAFIFGKVLEVPSDGVPYFLFFLAGSCTWMLFERGLRFVSRSFGQASSVMKKVYFPRLIAPFSAILPAAVNFGIYMMLLLGASVYYLVIQHEWYLIIGPRLLLGAVAVVLTLFFTVSVGLWTSVWMVKFPDLKFGLRYITRFWFYATPVIYPMSQVPPEHRWLVYVNPMAPLVETFKWSTLGIGEFPLGPLLTSSVVIAIVFVGGVWNFGRAETAAVDDL